MMVSKASEPQTRVRMTGVLEVEAWAGRERPRRGRRTKGASLLHLQWPVRRISPVKRAYCSLL